MTSILDHQPPKIRSNFLSKQRSNGLYILRDLQTGHPDRDAPGSLDEDLTEGRTKKVVPSPKASVVRPSP